MGRDITGAEVCVMEHGRTLGGDGPAGRRLAKRGLVLGAVALASGLLIYGLGADAEPVCTADGWPFVYGFGAGIALIVAVSMIVAGLVQALRALAKGAILLVPLAIVLLVVDVVVVISVMSALDQRWKSWCGG